MAKKKIDDLDLDFSELDAAVNEVESKSKSKAKAEPKAEDKKKAPPKKKASAKKAVEPEVPTMTEKQAEKILDNAIVTAKGFLKNGMTEAELKAVYLNALAVAQKISA